MEGNGDEESELELLLSTYDEIYHGFKDGITQIQALQSNCNKEIKKRETLQFSVDTLKSENERLAKLYTGSLIKLSDQLECRTNCEILKEELKRMTDEHIKKENGLRNAMESLKKDYEARSANMETQIRWFQVEKAGNEATINQLRKDLTAHRNHIEALASRLERVRIDVESRYELEIRDLKDCLSVEQEEKKELYRKLQRVEKELLLSRTKVVEQERDTSTNKNVEILKQKIMKLRKENEQLKRRQIMIVPKEER